MLDQEQIRRQIHNKLWELDYYAGLLRCERCIVAKNALFKALRQKIAQLSRLTAVLTAENATGWYSESWTIGLEQPVFTPETLARYNGKSGNPAYVAVAGIVYDVTDIAAWAAATHFGLAAGQDLTGQFQECHDGQPVLAQLPVVGRLQA
ncbi:MAG: cytochrome b5 domain-containing protein [Heliobacteriaceae bacterium]|nr:cytochrome b5 domain-containing protein [Heliobacteriaceae bacterium]